MLTNDSMPQSTIIPELGYADVSAAAEWLSRVFGFRVRLRIGDHRVQLTYEGGDLVVVHAAEPEGMATHRVMVRVPDVDRHYAHARAQGARVGAPPETYPYGERQYGAVDPGGHAWTFSQTVANVDPTSWGGVRS